MENLIQCHFLNFDIENISYLSKLIENFTNDKKYI